MRGSPGNSESVKKHQGDVYDGHKRGQKATLYDDYVCARCEAICAAHGVRKPASDINRMNAE